MFFILVHSGLSFCCDKGRAGANSDLVASAARGHENAAMASLARGASINTHCSFCGISPLSSAASSNHSEMIKFLLIRGAEIDLPDRITEMTPVHHAVVSGSRAALDVLLSYGASVNGLSRHKCRTALMMAVSTGERSTALQLIRHGASLETTDYFGNTVLFNAIENRNLQMIEILVDAGADLTFSDSNGRNSIHKAVTTGDEATVRFLLERGANPLFRDRWGRNSIDTAMLSGNLNIFRMCTEAAAKKRISESERLLQGSGLSDNLSDADVIELVDLFVDAAGRPCATISAGGRIHQVYEGDAVADQFRVRSILKQGVQILDFRDMTPRILWLRENFFRPSEREKERSE